MKANYPVYYTEEKYFSKNEVLNDLNILNCDSYWQEILAYRKNFGQQLELFNFDHTKFSFTFCKNQLFKLVDLERKYNMSYNLYNKLNSKFQKIFSISSLVKNLQAVANFNNITETDSFLANLVSGNCSTIPNQDLILDNYLNCLRYIQSLNEEKINITSIFKLYYGLIGGQFNKDSQINYPNVQVNNEKVDFEFLLNEFLNFVNDKKQYPFLQSIFSIFYIKFLKLFDFFNDELAILFCKLVLSCNGYNDFAIYLPMEKIFLKVDNSINQAFKNSVESNDLTYFVSCFSDKLLSSLEELYFSLNDSLKQEKSNENKLIINPNNLPSSNGGNDLIKQGVNQALESLKNNNNVEKVDDKEKFKIYGDIEVSLPIFNSGLRSEDLEKVTQDLLETYPLLKYSQAHFFARHCTVGRTYTIQNFKNEEHTSYETARTSMDFLASLGFYTKNQLKNKFVYRPIPRRKKINDE